MQITFFLEKGEIGGNQIRLSSKGESIWLDFGLSFKKTGKYVNPILEGKQLPKMKLDVLSREKIIPPLKYLEGELNVLISHAHLDHYGALFAPLEHLGHNIEGVKIFAPEDTLKLIKSRMEISAQGRLFERATLIPCSKDSKFEVSDFEIIPIEVDHSIDASYSYLIFTPEESIFYTGDFRFDLLPSERLLEKIFEYTNKIDVIITELTGVYRRNPLKEQDVQKEMEKVREKFSGFIVIFSTPSYTRRMQAIRSAFKERELVVDSTYAYLLYTIGKKELIDKVFVSEKKAALKPWEKELGKNFEIVSEDYIENNQEKIAMVLAPYHKLKLDFELKPKSVAIVSLTEPFDEDGFLFQSKLENFLLECRRIPVYQIHASGHAEAYEVADFVEKLNPRDIYVIHSQSPEVIFSLLPHIRNIHIPTYKSENNVSSKL
jgi:mRNA degradation ribonuclease J1/J2